MGSYKVRRLDLPKSIIEILEKQNLHRCKDVLCLTILELQSLFGVSYEEALKIQVEISKKCVSEPCTVYDLLRSQKKDSRHFFFPSSLHSLDVLLQGGLLLGSVTEISGPPGVGKTQFCFMLCVLATLPINLGGLNGQVIYIDTESAFSALRLAKIAKNRYPGLYQSDNNIQELLKRIFVHKASSVYALKEIIPNIEKEIILKKIKLVIVDSIASLFRKEYGASVFQSVVERNNILLEQAAILKDIAQTYNIVVFLTNQITSQSAEYDPTLSEYFVPEENGDDIDISSDISESVQPKVKKLKQQEAVNIDYISPALGVTWSHCVNTRLIAQFLDSHVRQLIIGKSPVAPNASIKYIINEAGISLTENDDIEYINTSTNEWQNMFTKYNFLTHEITGTGTIFSLNARLT